jgi:phosphonate transport system substrate-binding protein
MFVILRIAVVVTVALFCLGAAPAGRAGQTLTVGSISKSPAKETALFLPLARYLGERLGSEGIVKGDVFIAPDVQTMGKALRDGRVDLYIDSCLAAMAVAEVARSRMFARRWKKGVDSYSSMFIVRRESPIADIRDLIGQRVAFEEPHSTSGFLLPMIALDKAEIATVALKEPGDTLPNDRLGYVFSLKDSNTIAWVLRGRVAAGATDSEHILKLRDEVRRQLKIVYETPKVPRHVVSHRADLSGATLARISQLLFDMDAEDAGRYVLDQFEQTTRFDPMSSEMQDSLASLAPALRRVLSRH